MHDGYKVGQNKLQKYTKLQDETKKKKQSVNKLLLIFRMEHKS